MERPSRLVKLKFTTERGGERGVGLRFGELQGFFCSLHGVWKIPRLGIGGGQGVEGERIVAAAGLTCLGGQLDRPGTVSQGQCYLIDLQHLVSEQRWSLGLVLPNSFP